jgi:serine O-acetyltransferase
MSQSESASPPVHAPVPASVADALVASYGGSGQPFQHHSGYSLPSYPEVVSLIEDLRELLFPGFVGQRMGPADARAYVAARLEEVRARLRLQIYHGIHHRCMQHDPSCRDCEAQADAATLALVGQLPELRRVLMTDVTAALDGDPAASGPDEIIFCYPGLLAITVYRLANVLFRAQVPVIPRMMTEHAHRLTGIDIHPGATIGESFFIDHGTGVVIGETTDIGTRVRLYQGVTLGALSLSKENTVALRGHKRHPTLEDDAIIYANATILGGRTVIGKGAVIGGNCWITKSVAPGSKVSFLDANVK